MVRPLRIKYPGAFYHVMNRGSARQNIFCNSEDYDLFLDLLEKACENYNIEIHGYCLMTNHYHLLIRTIYPNLNRAMQYINGIFAQKINQRNKKDGPVFRGRYKSILVQAEEYLLVLSRYIHMNPVTAKIVSKPEQYQWSSYKYFVFVKETPSWLCRSEILKYFNDSKEYVDFVHAGKSEKITKIFDESRQPAVLGNIDFIESIKKCHKQEPNMTCELPQYSDLLKLNMLTITDVIEIISNKHSITKEQLLNSKIYLHDSYLLRDVTIFFASKMCEKSQKEIGKEFGISYARVSQIFNKMRHNYKNDSNLKEKIYEIEKLFLKLKI